MKKALVCITLASVAFLLVAMSAAAPLAAKKAVKSTAPSAAVNIGDVYVGPSVGFWHKIGFSVGGEKIMLKVEDWSGIIGFGAEIGYSSFDENYGYYGYDNWYWSYTYVPVFLFASYHYQMKDKRFDPYARLGFGYVYVSWKWHGDEDWGHGYGPNDSYLTIAGQVGIRYALSDKMALRAALGTPWVGSIGLDYKLR